ncbi:MAG: hypothetical protein M3N47_09220 [Chloroflexota bacterium]|nr:hypothetical protein [Chloroflexota bacterium]
MSAITIAFPHHVTARLRQAVIEDVEMHAETLKIVAGRASLDENDKWEEARELREHLAAIADLGKMLDQVGYCAGDETDEAEAQAFEDRLTGPARLIVSVTLSAITWITEGSDLGSTADELRATADVGEELERLHEQALAALPQAVA